MKIRDVLRTKGDQVVTVSSDGTVLSAMQILVEHNIGAVVVVDQGEIKGILSERDVLRLGAREPAALSTTQIGEVMTKELVICVDEDEVEYALNVMTRNRIRHLPIVEEGRLVGIVSIGDLVNVSREQVEFENRYLRDYIQGTAG
jgi:CBS domain-containing protein